jgi:hypothetical protein
MVSIRMLLTAGDPFLRRMVITPCVITQKGFDWKQRRISEGNIFLLQDCKSLSGLLVFVSNLVILWQEGSFFDDNLVVFYNVRMAGW